MVLYSIESTASTSQGLVGISVTASAGHLSNSDERRLTVDTIIQTNLVHPVYIGLGIHDIYAHKQSSNNYNLGQ